MAKINGAMPLGIKAQERRIKQAFSSSRILVFGNTQGNRAAIKTITAHARAQDIRNIVSLGRFTRGDCMGGHGETPNSYLENYRLLLQWVKEAPETRLWLGIVGKYDYMPHEDIANEAIAKHMSADGTREQCLFFYRSQNLFFAHLSDTLVRAFEGQGAEINPNGPAILFFAHSYYMGLNLGGKPDYYGNGPKRMAAPSYQEIHPLKNGGVYWVSTGPNMQLESGVNFAIYDPIKKMLTLQTLCQTL